MANNLGVTTGSDATIKTTDNTSVHTPHHNIEVAGVAPAMNTGVRGSTVLRVTQATDDNDLGSGTGGSKTQRVIIDTSQVDSVAHDASDSGAPSKIGGYASTAVPSAVSGDGDRVNAWYNRNGAAVVTPVPHTVGGLAIFRSIDLDESEEDVKTSAGQIYGMWVTNTATSTRFVKLYNATAANVTVGSTTPVITIGIPGNSSDDVSGLFSSTHGIAFDTAITAAATTGVADADTGAPGANEVIVNIFYK